MSVVRLPLFRIFATQNEARRVRPGDKLAVPIQLVAAALAGCTAFDVITILRNKKHKTVTGYEVTVEAEQQSTPPQVFTQVRVHHAISGTDIDDQSVKNAIQLSESKYCSVEAMISQSGAEVTTTYSITPRITPSQVESGARDLGFLT